MRGVRAFAILLILAAWLALGGCMRRAASSPDEATPEPTPPPEIKGTIVYSGQWQGLDGTFSFDLATDQVNSLSGVASTLIQTSGYVDEFMFVYPTGQVYIAPFSSSEARLVADASEAFLSPNGRKFFFNDPQGGLYEGAAAAYGGLLFSADGLYGSHSPDLTTVAYLTTAGLVLSKADGSGAATVDLTKLLFTDEQFVLPTDGDFFPRWSPDGGLVAATLVVQNSSSGDQRTIVVIADPNAQLVQDISNGTAPVWNADGKSFFYVSNKQLWRWDLVQNANTLIAGGAENACREARVNDDGSLLTFVQEDSGGLLSLIVLDLITGKPFVLIPGSIDGVLSIDWLHSSYCGGQTNTAPTVAVEVLIDGQPSANPVVTPGANAQFRLTVHDAECNLGYGVALWQVGSDPWRPLATALPAGSGCSQTQVDAPAPANPDGAYQMNVAVEDVCGARSAAVSFPITYQGFGGDDDAADDDALDDDTTT
jgi:hypothetical protein